MAAQKKYPDELRERAVKMLFEVREREGRGRGELAPGTAEARNQFDLRVSVLQRGRLSCQRFHVQI
jgi:hypothetical protein